jgi:Domain of unknown function (DUF4276)
MRLHFLVEGPGEEAFLRAWLPRFLRPGHSFAISPHQGKGRLSAKPHKRPDPKQRGLLDQLPAKLRAYGKTLQADTDRVVVLVDLDDQDCYDLKKRLVALLKHCDPKPVVLFRIAIEETEAFFLGDAPALKLAFPGAKTGKLRKYELDSICGAWELLRDIIGEEPESEDKVAWAQAIAPHLTVKWQGRSANKSPSFQQFCRGIRKLCGESLPE